MVSPPKTPCGPVHPALRPSPFGAVAALQSMSLRFVQPFSFSASQHFSSPPFLPAPLSRQGRPLSPHPKSKFLATIFLIPLLFLGAVLHGDPVYSIDINDADSPVTAPGFVGLSATHTGNGGSVSIDGVAFAPFSADGSRLRGSVGSPNPDALTGDFVFDDGAGQAVGLAFGGAGHLAAGTWQVELWIYDPPPNTFGPVIVGWRRNGAETIISESVVATTGSPAVTFNFDSDGGSAYDVFVRENNDRNRSRLNAVRLTLLEAAPEGVGRNNNYVIDAKHADTVDGYFTTTYQMKARAYWETEEGTSVTEQVGFPASSKTADVYVPISYREDKPVGIYIHINSGDNANLPSQFDPVLEDLYLIGGSPDHAGNTRDEMRRNALALDLVASLKARYNVDDSRVYIGGLSGGAANAAGCALLYPDVFAGAIPTEHTYEPYYWARFFTWTEMKDMAGNGQRWAHIFGTESYALSHLVSDVRVWEELFEDTLVHIVEGMDHTNAPAADFRYCLEWIEAETETPSEEPWAFDAPGQLASKLSWQGTPGRSFDLWSSNNLKNWIHVDEFPQWGRGKMMEYAFPSGEPRRFFRIDSNPAGQLVPIPGGTFEMGNAFEDGSGDAPLHTVQVSPFFMQNTEVTMNQAVDVLNWGLRHGLVSVYKETYGTNLGERWYYRINSVEGYIAGTGGHTGIWWIPEENRVVALKSGGRGYPCVGFGRDEAIAYANLLSRMEGLTRCYTEGYSGSHKAFNFDADGYRLPTEAEWEWAARGGLVGKRYPWGDTINHSKANYTANGSAFGYDTTPYAEDTLHPDWSHLKTFCPSPVAIFAPNAYGLYDMAGNVSELCNDSYVADYYTSSPVIDPTGPDSGYYAVARGGSWELGAQDARVDTRSHHNGSNLSFNNDIGFRLVRRVRSTR